MEPVGLGNKRKRGCRLIMPKNLPGRWFPFSEYRGKGIYTRSCFQGRFMTLLGRGKPTHYHHPRWMLVIHPKLRNLNLHNVSHSLISQYRRERMFVVQISLFIVTFLFLVSRVLSLMQSAKVVNPHPRIAPCVNMWSVTFLFLFFFFFFFFLWHLLNVGACICHSAWEGQVEWTTPHHWNVALCVIP